MASTLAYVGRRFLNLLIVIWIAGTLNFAIPRLIPGDPVQSAFATLAAQGGRANDIAVLKASWDKKLGLDAPLPVQYVNYWVGVATLDFGISVTRYPAPAGNLIWGALPWTIGLLGVSTLIAFVVGTLMGALLAWPRSPRFVRVLAAPFLLLSSIPYYLLAILLIAIFAGALRLLPPASGFSPSLILGWNMKSVLDIANHAILPSLSIVLGAIGFWALGMRALMIGELGTDYISYADSKGLRPRRVFLRYGLRNALVPQITALALALATVVSGAVLVEAIFAYPGLGGLLYKSIVAKDIFVVNGIVTILIITLGVGVFLIDLTLPILDPRIRRS